VARFASTGGWGQIYVSNSTTTVDLGADTGIGYTGTNSAGDFDIRTGATPRIRLQDGTGHVGIGTTTPRQRLDVAGNVAVSGPLGVVADGADRPLITRAWNVFTSGNYQNAGRWGVFMEPNALTFGVPDNGNGRRFQWVRYAANSTITNQLMSLSQAGDLAVAGNVGIGTTTPTQNLDVAGAARVQEAVFARALTGMEYEYDIGPSPDGDNQNHIVQCTTGWAIVSVNVYASNKLDGYLTINCANLTGLVNTSSGGTWRYGPGTGADNQEHEASCNAGEVATGWRITATGTYLDGNVGLLCRPLAAGYTRGGQYLSANTIGTLSGSNGLDNQYHSGMCMPGSFLTSIRLYAGTQLEALTDVYCATIRSN
jgi:hypothetical protein